MDVRQRIAWSVAASLALASPATSADPGPGLLLGVRGVAEVWQDPSLTAVYRTSRFAGTGVASYPIVGPFRLDVEVGYHRMSGSSFNLQSGGRGEGDTVFEMLPMSLRGTWSPPSETVEPFVSVGPAITVFNEVAPDLSVAGTKFGVLAEAGVRVDTGLVRSSLRPSGATPVRRLDLEVSLGRRQHQAFGVGEGLDLSAWRAGAGLVARF